jgi:hypothetical protein
MRDDKDYLDDFFTRPKPPVNSETKARRFVGIVVGRRATPHGGIAQTLQEVEAAGAIMEARERRGPNLSGIMGEDSRWPLPFYNMDGTLDPMPARRDGTVSPLTVQEERDLMEGFGVTAAEYIELMTRGPIK